MTPKDRLRKNKPLPQHWRWDKNGAAIYYRVPARSRHLYDRGEIRLGANLTEAHREYSRLIAEVEAPHSVDIKYPSMAVLIDQYMLTVTPTKSPGTQEGELRALRKLRGIYGAMHPAQVTSQHINQVKHATAEKSGKPTANAHLRILSHVFTMGIEWGALKDHPMVNKQVVAVKVPKKRHHEPSDTELDAALELAPPIIEAYVQIKIRTGLRQTDLLLMKRSQISREYLEVPINKVRDQSGKVLQFEMTPDLRHWLDRACRINRHRVNSLWVFQTRDGRPYIDDRFRADGFGSIWQRWQKKVAAAGMERFQERKLRNKAANDLESLAEAKELLGHDRESTTAIYRDNVIRVRPIRK